MLLQNFNYSNDPSNYVMKMHVHSTCRANFYMFQLHLFPGCCTGEPHLLIKSELCTLHAPIFMIKFLISWLMLIGLILEGHVVNRKSRYNNELDNMMN